MRHIKKFQLFESVDLDGVELDTNDEESAVTEIENIISQVESATGEEVEFVEGVADDLEVNLTLDLRDGSAVDIFYRRTQGQGAGRVDVNYELGGEVWSAEDTDPEIRAGLTPGREVEGVLKALLKRPDPKYTLYHFEMDEELGVAQIDLTFNNLREAEEWINSLHGMLKRKLGDTKYKN